MPVPNPTFESAAYYRENEGRQNAAECQGSSQENSIHLYAKSPLSKLRSNLLAQREPLQLHHAARDERETACIRERRAL